MCIFFSPEVRWPRKQPAQSGLPSFSWIPQGTRTLVPAATTGAIHPLQKCRWVWLSLSWLLNLPYWLRVWVWFGSGAGYQPPPRWKDTGVGRVKYRGQTHSRSRHWVGLGWKIPRNSHPVERYWVGGCLKDAREYPASGKVLGGGRVFYWKKSGNTGGSAERCWGHSVVGDWVVLAEWLGKRPILHFSSVRLPL